LPVDSEITYGELPNGLRYAVRENDTPTKTATLLMRIDTGSINETNETRGLAHFLEHMAFNGSENIPEGEMTKRLERFGLAFGADTNASTSFYETTYQLELPDVTEEMLDVTLGIMRETAERLSLDPEAIENERGVIQAERRTRSNPSFKAFLDQLDFYTGHTILPDRLPIGTEATIDTVTPEQFWSGTSNLNLRYRKLKNTLGIGKTTKILCRAPNLRLNQRRLRRRARACILTLKSKHRSVWRF